MNNPGSLWGRILEKNEQQLQWLEQSCRPLGLIGRWLGYGILPKVAFIIATIVSVVSAGIYLSHDHHHCKHFMLAFIISGCVALGLAPFIKWRVRPWHTFKLLVIAFMVLTMLQISSVNSRAVPQTNVTQNAELANVCGPLCMFIVLVVIIGVVWILISGLLSMCKNLDKPKRRPPAADDQFAPQRSDSLKAGDASKKITTTGTFFGAVPQTNAVSAYDITGTNEDGTTNDIQFDRTGTNRYSVMFQAALLSSTSADDWSEAKVTAVIRGWVSFAPGSQSYSVGNGQTRMSPYSKPANVLVVCYTNGVVASRTYTAINETPDLNGGGIQIPFNQDKPKEFFKLAPLPLD